MVIQLLHVITRGRACIRGWTVSEVHRVELARLIQPHSPQLYPIPFRYIRAHDRPLQPAFLGAHDPHCNVGKQLAVGTTSPQRLDRASSVVHAAVFRRHEEQRREEFRGRRYSVFRRHQDTAADHDQLDVGRVAVVRHLVVVEWCAARDYLETEVVDPEEVQVAEVLQGGFRG